MDPGGTFLKTIMSKSHDILVLFFFQRDWGKLSKCVMSDKISSQWKRF